MKKEYRKAKGEGKWKYLGGELYLNHSWGACSLDLWKTNFIIWLVYLYLPGQDPMFEVSSDIMKLDESKIREIFHVDVLNKNLIICSCCWTDRASK